MDIFESLENLDVSEKCFEDIVGLVEEYINELKEETARNALKKRLDNNNKFIEGIRQYLKDARDEGTPQEEYDQMYQRGGEAIGDKLTDNTKRINFYNKWRKGHEERRKN